jgi:predicted RNA-binding protein YlxR (DUF448 family)
MVLPAERLVRFVVDPGGMLCPDIKEMLPGRGLWVSADRAALDSPKLARGASRSLKRTVMVPPELAARVEGLLLRRCGEVLGLARRSGMAVAGYEKVREQLARRRCGVLLAASDGSLDGRAKLRTLSGEAPVISALTADEIGAAFGRPRAVHAMVGVGRLADLLRREADRLVSLRGMARSATIDNLPQTGCDEAT